LAEKRREQRAGVLKEAFEKNPERFVRGLPKPALLPAAAWINKPKEISSTDSVKGMNPSMDDSEQKNDLIRSPLTNDRLSTRGIGRGENHSGEDVVG
jgi:hypothetical protein